MAVGHTILSCVTYTILVVFYWRQLLYKDTWPLLNKQGSDLLLSETSAANLHARVLSASPCDRLYHCRHLGSLQPRGKRFLSSRLAYYSNSTATFQELRLSCSGDICPNPGPVSRENKAICSVCNKTVAGNHRAIICDLCSLWCHIKCGKVTPTEYQKFTSVNSFSWSCPTCVMTLQSLPFADVSCLAFFDRL